MHIRYLDPPNSMMLEKKNIPIEDVLISAKVVDSYKRHQKYSTTLNKEHKTSNTK